MTVLEELLFSLVYCLTENKFILDFLDILS